MNTHTLRFFLIVWFLFSFASLAIAQQNSGTPSTSSPALAADKSGKDASCDGALEIIPSGQVSFVRKRYVSANPKTKPRLPKSRANSRK
ncbi:MAG: hypothetical protein JNM09_08550 [Blastocatellia bacterium]|nr:hypothetical protein [Blastocatellia bacterium]